MWIADMKINGSNSLLGSRAKEYNVSISGYPISIHEKSNGVYLVTAGLVFGAEKNIRAMIKDLKKDKRVISLEHKDHFVIAEIFEPPMFRAAHHHKIIRIKPVLISEDGFEYWTIGCMNKQELINFINLYEKTHQGQLIKLKQETVTDLSIFRILPKFTSLQKRAFEIAVKNGYYNYPRDIEVLQIANLMKRSYATCHAHLRKAEKAIIPLFLDELKK